MYFVTVAIIRMTVNGGAVIRDPANGVFDIERRRFDTYCDLLLLKYNRSVVSSMHAWEDLHLQRHVKR